MIDFVRPLSSDEILIGERRKQLLSYYGIPFGVFDDTEDSSIDIKEKDRRLASLLIMSNSQIPKDLEQRLLQYKKDEELKKKV